jgi:hypothetical protein
MNSRWFQQDWNAVRRLAISLALGAPLVATFSLIYAQGHAWYGAATWLAGWLSAVLMADILGQTRGLLATLDELKQFLASNGSKGAPHGELPVGRDAESQMERTRISLLGLRLRDHLLHCCRGERDLHSQVEALRTGRKWLSRLGTFFFIGAGLFVMLFLDKIHFFVSQLEAPPRIDWHVAAVAGTCAVAWAATGFAAFMRGGFGEHTAEPILSEVANAVTISEAKPHWTALKLGEGEVGRLRVWELLCPVATRDFEVLVFRTPDEMRALMGFESSEIGEDRNGVLRLEFNPFDQRNREALKSALRSLPRKRELGKPSIHDGYWYIPFTWKEDQ